MTTKKHHSVTVFIPIPSNLDLEASRRAEVWKSLTALFRRFNPQHVRDSEIGLETPVEGGHLLTHTFTVWK